MTRPPEPHLLEFRHVSVVRGGRPVLHDVTLAVGLGEHVAVLGPNGSGKSTLIRTITRECYPLDRPGSGVSILGREAWDVFALRPMLGIVSPGPALTDGLSGREVVLAGFFASAGLWGRSGQVTGEMEARTLEALERLEVAHLADRPVARMSSGEARRVLIARALVHRPRALLLDEPSTSLDLFAQHELRRILRKLAGEGMGILLVTHHLGDIIPEIGRVVLLRDGRIVDDGPKERLLTAGSLGRLFGVGVRVARRDGFYHAW